jgi:hypothetical protein
MKQKSKRLMTLLTRTIKTKRELIVLSDGTETIALVLQYWNAVSHPVAFSHHHFVMIFERNYRTGTAHSPPPIWANSAPRCSKHPSQFSNLPENVEKARSKRRTLTRKEMLYQIFCLLSNKATGSPVPLSPILEVPILGQERVALKCYVTREELVMIPILNRSDPIIPPILLRNRNKITTS